MRTALKKAEAPGATAEVKTAATTLLDRAARKGLIHANNAARHKSRIAKATA
ncbi:MAG TPA: 30S ribosomal protein S20 [Gemmatimonadaceae bacterium]